MKVVSIRDKLIVGVGTCLVLSLAAVIAYSSYTIRQQAIYSAKRQALAGAQIFAGQVNTTVEHVLQTVDTIASSLSGVNRWETKITLSRDTVLKILQNLLIEHSGFLAVYAVWEPDAFDNFDFANRNRPGSDAAGRFVPFWIRAEQGEIFLRPMPYANLDNETEPQRYLVPKKTMKAVVIPPGVKANGVFSPIFSVIVPIVADGKFWGVIGVDLDSLWLQTEAQSYDGFPQGTEISIVNEVGTILAHSELPRLIGENIKVLGELDLERDLNTLREHATGAIFDDDYLEIFHAIDIDHCAS